MQYDLDETGVGAAHPMAGGTHPFDDQVGNSAHIVINPLALLVTEPNTRLRQNSSNSTPRP